jgi:predicted RNase H-like nuclease (RuvC/YqgF family)
MKTNYLLVLFTIISVSISAQNRKEQIATLTARVDSLNAVVLNNEKDIKTKESAIKGLNAGIIKRDSTIKALGDDIELYESKFLVLKDTNSKLESELKTITQKFSEIEYQQSSTSGEISKLKKEIEQKNNQIVALQKKYEIYEVSEFVQRLYSSLEQPGNESGKINITDSTRLDLSKFNSLLDSNAVYSNKRIEILSGINNSRYLVKLVKIESVSNEGGSFIVVANVEYDIYETGTFYNNELLLIKKSNGQFKLSKWSDINMQKMVLLQSEGLQNFAEKDFYNIIGSINK